MFTTQLGKTGMEISRLIFGGIVVSKSEPKDAARWVGEAAACGVNYFDVAPSYGDAEEKLGPALEPYRKGVYLACKTAQRSREGARGELESSLRRLRTDYFDVYQLHALTTIEDVEQCFGPDGAMEGRAARTVKVRVCKRAVSGQLGALPEPAVRVCAV